MGVSRVVLINRESGICRVNIFHTTLLTSPSVPGLTAALYVGGLKIDQRSVALAKAALPGNETVVLAAQWRAGSVSRPLRSALHSSLAAAGWAATSPQRDRKQRADAQAEKFALTMTGLKTRETKVQC